MSTDNLWNTVLGYTQELVDAPAFKRIVNSCPYFEGWWMVELAQRFAGPDKRPHGYQLAGFDVLAVSDERPTWQPDLLLDFRTGPQLNEIAWVELKQINLRRKGDAKQLNRPIQNICRDYGRVWKRARKVNLNETSKKFQDSNCLQNLTLDPVYREKPERFLSASHVAAAFMLAAIPEDLMERFRKTLETNLLQLRPSFAPEERAQLLCRPIIAGKLIEVHLFGLLGQFK